MRLFLVLAVYLVIRADSAHAVLRRRSHETHDYFALQLRPQAAPREAALNLGLRHEGPIGELPNHHAFSVAKDRNRADIPRLLHVAREAHNGSEVPFWVSKLGPADTLQKRIIRRVHQTR